MSKLSPEARALIAAAARREHLPSEEELCRARRSVLVRAASAGAAAAATGGSSLAAKAAIAGSGWIAHVVPFAVVGAIAGAITVGSVSVFKTQAPARDATSGSLVSAQHRGTTIAPVSAASIPLVSPKLSVDTAIAHDTAIGPAAPAGTQGASIAGSKPPSAGVAQPKVSMMAPWASAAAIPQSNRRTAADQPASPDAHVAVQDTRGAQDARGVHDTRGASDTRAVQGASEAHGAERLSDSRVSAQETGVLTHSASEATPLGGAFTRLDVRAQREGDRSLSRDLELQLEVLRRVRAELVAGHGWRVIELLDASQAVFPEGAALEEQAWIARVNALCQVGRIQDARAEIGRVLARWPNSLVSSGATAGCAMENSQTGPKSP